MRLLVLRSRLRAAAAKVREEMKRPSISYVDACTDPNLFGPWFTADSWKTWRVIDKAIFGLPLNANELATFTELTGRAESPTEPVREAWLTFGRRSGKDVKAASYAVYQATIGAEVYGYRKHLVRGERGVVQILAVDRDQAKVAFNYALAFFEQPILAKLVKRTSADTIELTNGLAIEVTTNDRRRVRGRTVICAILDELAHWRSENTVTPDDEVYGAIVPAMATIPNALLIGISSPYSRRGLLWKKFSDHWGKPGNVLAARAPTWRMNPTIAKDGEFLASQYAKDPTWAASEFGAEWRTDLEAFVSLEAIRDCITSGVRERLPDRKNAYVAFVDPSGGSNDSFTMAIAHSEGVGTNKTQILDALRERKPPFSPEGVVEEFAALLRQYRVTKVHGDKYAGEWPREQFSKRGVHYETAERTKSQLYQDLLPLINSGAVDLLDNDRLVQQLVGLERRTARGGKDSIDHAPGLHDDLCNVAAGAITTAYKNPGISNFRNIIEFPNVGVA
jgi:hypothetical protein